MELNKRIVKTLYYSETAPEKGTDHSEEYEVQKTLGVGGYGQVLHVVHGNQGEFALKIATLTNNPTHDKAAIKDIMNEFNFFKVLRDQNVAHVIKLADIQNGIGYERGTRFPLTLIMEFCNQGGPSGWISDIAKKIKEKEMPSEAYFTATRILINHGLRGLNEIHKCGYVHGDVGVKNFIVNENNQNEFCVKVCDFGKTGENTGEDKKKGELTAFLQDVSRVILNAIYMKSNGSTLRDLVGKTPKNKESANKFVEELLIVDELNVVSSPYQKLF